MTKYGEFIEAYKKAFPLVRKKLQYEQANKIWSALKKLKPDEFEQQFKEKMSEFKLLTAGNCLKNLKTFTQSRLSFGKAKIPVVTCCDESTHTVSLQVLRPLSFHCKFQQCILLHVHL